MNKTEAKKTADAVTEKDCRLSKWDVVDYLDSEENIAEYLEAVAETGGFCFDDGSNQ